MNSMKLNYLAVVLMLPLLVAAGSNYPENSDLISDHSYSFKNTGHDDSAPEPVDYEHDDYSFNQSAPLVLKTDLGKSLNSSVRRHPDCYFIAHSIRAPPYSK